MKIYTATFTTASKTAADILATYDSHPPSLEEAEKAAEAYRSLDGLEITVGHSFTGNYSLYGWRPEDDEKIRDFIYYAAEQDALFGSYVDEREEFLLDWANDEYEPMGSIAFDKSELKDFKAYEESDV